MRVNTGSNPAKRRFGASDRSRQQLVWFGPIGFDAGSAGLCGFRATSAALRPSAAPKSGVGAGSRKQLPGGAPCCTRRPSSRPPAPASQAAAAESWWLTIRIVASRCTDRAQNRGADVLSTLAGHRRAPAAGASSHQGAPRAARCRCRPLEGGSPVRLARV